jgi:hypothetical protein
MKKLLITMVSIFALNAQAEVRCGWFFNPTPANFSFVDRDGEWVIGLQGMEQADGQENVPEFTVAEEWSHINVNYGYGCACLEVLTESAKDKSELRLLPDQFEWFGKTSAGDPITMVLKAPLAGKIVEIKKSTSNKAGTLKQCRDDKYINMFEAALSSPQ